MNDLNRAISEHRGEWNNVWSDDGKRCDSYPLDWKLWENAGRLLEELVEPQGREIQISRTDNFSYIRKVGALDAIFERADSIPHAIMLAYCWAKGITVGYGKSSDLTSR